MDHEDDDPGTTWNERVRARQPSHMSPRMAWRAIQASLPRDAIISSDIGNNCAIGNAYPTFEQGRKYLAPGLFGPCGYGFPAIIGAKIGNPDTPVVGFAGDGAFGISMNEMTACGRNEWPPITMIIFRNYQWGAEKRNTTLWYDDNFVGTELDLDVSFAAIARACGMEGVLVTTMSSLTDALNTAVGAQLKDKLTTFIEVVLKPGTRGTFQARCHEKTCRGGRCKQTGHAAANGRFLTVSHARRQPVTGNFWYSVAGGLYRPSPRYIQILVASRLCSNDRCNASVRRLTRCEGNRSFRSDGRDNAADTGYPDRKDSILVLNSIATVRYCVRRRRGRVVEGAPLLRE